jgi:hypothetical protein
MKHMLNVAIVLQRLAEDAAATTEGSMFEESSMEPDGPRLILSLDSDDEPDPFSDVLMGSELFTPETCAATHASDSCLKPKPWCQLGSPVPQSNKASKTLLQPDQVCSLGMEQLH